MHSLRRTAVITSNCVECRTHSQQDCRVFIFNEGLLENMPVYIIRNTDFPFGQTRWDDLQAVLLHGEALMWRVMIWRAAAPWIPLLMLNHTAEETILNWEHTSLTLEQPFTEGGVIVANLVVCLGDLIKFCMGVFVWGNKAFTIRDNKPFILLLKSLVNYFCWNK